MLVLRIYPGIKIYLLTYLQEDDDEVGSIHEIEEEEEEDLMVENIVTQTDLTGESIKVKKRQKSKKVFFLN